MKLIIDGKTVEIPSSGGSGGVPVGSIIIWSGSAADIPSGWALCDGQDGRPDLRDRFVLGGGGTHTIGDTGGEETHTLTVDEMPEHSHKSYIYINSETPRHDVLKNDVFYDNGWASPNSRPDLLYNTGGSQSHNNMPPYYVLCYIIKVSGGSDSGGSGGGTPIGTVISVLGLTAPAGYLICDGAEYSVSDHPKLAAYFAAQFGAANHFGGDGTVTFAVPDMRNLFLRGYHGEAEEQLSGEIGVKQVATASPHIVLDFRGSNNNLIGFCEEGKNNWVQYADSERVGGKGYSRYLGGLKSDKSTEHPSYYTSRPVNMAVLYCIKEV